MYGEVGLVGAEVYCNLVTSFGNPPYTALHCTVVTILLLLVPLLILLILVFPLIPLIPVPPAPVSSLVASVHAGFS